MAQRGRRGLTTSQKAELWRRWKDGQSLTDIGLALGKHAASIHSVLLPKGGIAPATRRRSRLALSLAEREEISRGIVPPMHRSARSQRASGDRRPRSAAKRDGVDNGEQDGVPAIVMAIHTFGEYLDFHPHLHALVSDGLFDREGRFELPPISWTPKLARMLARRVSWTKHRNGPSAHVVASLPEFKAEAVGLCQIGDRTIPPHRV